MAKLKSNVKVERHENLWIIDPNGDGTNAVNLEDLNISVELEVLVRGDEPVIYTNNTVTTSKGVNNKATRISFIDGAGNEEKYLTTQYTELNTKFNDKNKDLGTLGIESIDISFNTSYVPIVKIRFKDIRGQLFELGNDSPYAFMFKMPYPIFYLTVKGYFGKPVQYALHMTKFNGNLDNESGSFIITCDFIGYTYAFLADLLMGIIKGIPYTQEGMKLMPNGFTTFEELHTVIKNLEDYITAYREDNQQLKALAIYDKLNSKLSTIEDSILRDMKVIFGDSPYNYVSLEDTGVGTSQNMFRGNLKYSNNLNFTDGDKNRYENSTLKLVKEYNEENSSIGDATKFKLNINDFKLNKNGIFNDSFFAFDFLKDDQLLQNANGESYTTKIPLTFQEFQKSSKLSNYPIFKLSNDDIIDSYKEQLYDYTIDIINIKSKKNPNSKAYVNSFGEVLDIRLVLFKIQNLKIEIQKSFDEEKKLVTENFTQSINSFLQSQGTQFDGSIGKLFKILCEHVDLFMNVIKSVEAKIEDDRKNGTRKLPAASKRSFSEYLDEDGSTQISVGAFPEFIEDESGVGDGKGGLVEKWLGSDPRFVNYEEVKFINDLYASMIKSGQKDKEISSGVLSQTKSWFPVNPLETLAANKSNTNPWQVAADSNIQPVMKLILQRMTTLLSYSYSNLSLEEVSQIAKIEANQLYNTLLNGPTKKAIMPNNVTEKQFEEQIYLYYGDSEKSFGKVGDNYGLRMYFKDISPLYFWETNDGDGNLTYHHDKSNERKGGFSNFDSAFNDRREYIPLTQTKAVLESPENVLNIGENRPTFNGTFISNIISNTPLNEGTNNEEEYETFIKIIDKGDYNKSLNYDTYITGGNNIVFNEGETIIGNSELLGGLYRTHEFIQYQNGTQITPLYYEFYDSSTKTKLINKDIKSSNAFIFNPEFKTITGNGVRKKYSLFGSKLYNSQTNIYGKALLFLHSIPFNGFDKVPFGTEARIDILDNRNIKFFNERAGFISVPKTWVLLMGGLLYRESEAADILTFLDNDGNSLIPNINTTDKILKDAYLIFSKFGVFDETFETPISLGEGPITFADYSPAANSGEIGGEIGYKKLSKIIKKLPESVKKVFRLKFINWVTTDWLAIRNELEIFDDGVTNETIINDWTVVNNNSVSFNAAALKSNVKTNYSITANSQVGNFDLTIISNSELSRLIYNLFLDEEVIINGTYRIWGGSDDRLTNFRIPKDKQQQYITTFLSTYRDLNKGIIDPESEIRQTLFNTDNVDDIKLSLYKNIKSIYNKWVLGVHPDMGPDVITNDLYKSFNFLDRAYVDIRDKFKISPTGFINYLVSNTNINFYNFIARILRDNNFDFIPLPTFIDYSSEANIKSIFEPVKFNDMVETKGPQFICMYFGEQSNQLNVEKKNKRRPSDSFGVTSKYGPDGNLIITDKDNIPKDFNVSNGGIPYFLVNYADQNQSIFKNIDLDQSEFTETNESLEIIESLSNLNRNNSIGQNLFDIYNNRSYSAEVEMLGCAQIQPFMFFQVNNVPVFDGAYTIINTRHRITANHMTTTFKGVRIRRIKTKMVDDETLYAHLLANLNEVDTRGASLTSSNNSRNSTVSTKVNSEILKQNQISVKKYLKDKGYSKEIVAGIMGNIQIESAFKLGALNASDSNSFESIGLIQWNRLSYPDVFNLFNNNEFSTVQEQLDYLTTKMGNKGWTSFISEAKKENTTYDEQYVAFLFAHYVEGCCGCRNTRGYTTLSEIYSGPYTNGWRCPQDNPSATKFFPHKRSQAASGFIKRFNDSTDSLYWA